MGIFAKDYESAGPGIAKNAPKKTGIRLFFDIFFRKIWKLAEVNLLYSLFFLPLILILAVITLLNDSNIIITLSIILLLIFAVLIGPATAGMTKIIRSYILDKHSFIVRDFFRAFRNNFKKAAVVGFLDCVVLLSVYASFQVYPVLASIYGNFMYAFMVITFSFSLVVLMMNYYIYLMMTATTLSLKNLLKNSFALAFVGLKKNIISFLVFLVTAFAMFMLYVYFRPLCMMILPFFPAAFLCFVTGFNSYPVIQQYVINPYYTSIGEINPELVSDIPEEGEAVFEDMGGKEKPIEKRKKGKGRRIS